MEKELNAICLPEDIIPRDAYFYFPPLEEQVFFSKNKKEKFNKRQIFGGNLNLSDYEKNKYEKLENLLQEELLLDEVNVYFDTNEKLRYLQGNDWKVKKSKKDLIKTTDMRKRLSLVGYSEAITYICNSGILYVHGRDSKFRPILVFRPDLFVKNRNNFSLYEFKIAIVYLLDTVARECFISGQVENFIVILDISLFLN